jgi:hypothetical protein
MAMLSFQALHSDSEARLYRLNHLPLGRYLRALARR